MWIRSSLVQLSLELINLWKLCAIETNASEEKLKSHI